MNNDGKLDLVATTFDTAGAYSDDYYIDVVLGHGDGTFATVGTTRAGYNYTTSPVLGDFNGDGKLDVAVLNGGQVDLLAGNGDGTLQADSLIRAEDLITSPDWRLAIRFL